MSINLDDPNIMTATDASIIWGKNRDYVRTSLNKTPEKWKKGTWHKFGKVILVTVEGMELATGQKDPRKKD